MDRSVASVIAGNEVAGVALGDAKTLAEAARAARAVQQSSFRLTD